ncbi:MAG: dienelactone hydrolase family protein [Chloroflexota bacterium]|nr:MAG: dienelactone hydrolase family protein [Chloroflexota bacterium]
MTRREMVRRAVYITGGTASAATALVALGCAPAATPTAVPAPTNTTAPIPTNTVAAAAKPAAEAAKPAAGAAKPTPAPPATPTGPRSPLAVKPDDPAIDGKAVEFAGEAGKVFGYLARPKATGTYPGLIVIHENRGLVPHIQDVARRAAKEGYVALAVDLLSRNGGSEKVTDPAQVGGMLGQAKPDDLVADLSSGVKFLQSQDGVKKDRIGAFGFCFGGGYTWRLAVGNREIRAAVPFYGPAPPVEMVPNTNAAILGIYAENDTRINASIPPLEEALKKAGKTYEIKVYPGVNHAFHNDTGASWSEKVSLDAWQATFAWFKKHLAT